MIKIKHISQLWAIVRSRSSNGLTIILILISQFSSQGLICRKRIFEKFNTRRDKARYCHGSSQNFKCLFPVSVKYTLALGYVSSIRGRTMIVMQALIHFIRDTPCAVSDISTNFFTNIENISLKIVHKVLKINFH